MKIYRLFIPYKVTLPGLNVFLFDEFFVHPWALRSKNSNIILALQPLRTRHPVKSNCQMWSCARDFSFSSTLESRNYFRANERRRSLDYRSSVIAVVRWPWLVIRRSTFPPKNPSIPPRETNTALLGSPPAAFTRRKLTPPLQSLLQLLLAELFTA